MALTLRLTDEQEMMLEQLKKMTQEKSSSKALISAAEQYLEMEDKYRLLEEKYGRLRDAYYGQKEKVDNFHSAFEGLFKDR